MRKVSCIMLLIAVFAAASVAQLTDSQIFFNAAFMGDIKSMKAVVAKGIDINQTDVRDKTALVVAADRGKLNIVKFLVSKGADIHYRGKKGNRWYTALSAAAIQGHYLVGKFLIDSGAVIRSQDVAYAASTSFPLLKYMAEKGADISGRHARKMTTLMYAAGNGKLESVRYLVEKGADLNAVDSQGKTALDWAKRNKRGSVIQYLEGVMK